MLMPQPTHTILLVDDEDDVRRLVGETLRLQGHKILDYPDGDRVLLSLHGEALERVDLLLTDVIMPGLDGCELARRLRVPRPGLPVLFMSGYAHAQVPGHIGRINENEFIQNPFAL